MRNHLVLGLVSLAVCSALAVRAPAWSEELGPAEKAVIAAIEKSLAAVPAGDAAGWVALYHSPFEVAVVTPDEGLRVLFFERQQLESEGFAFLTGQLQGAKKFELLEPKVYLLSDNVAVAVLTAKPGEGAPENARPLQFAMLLSSGPDGWKAVAVAAGETRKEADEETKKALTELLKQQSQAILHGDTEAYCKTHRTPLMRVDAEAGTQQLGAEELKQAASQFTDTVKNYGLDNVSFDLKAAHVFDGNLAAIVFRATGYIGGQPVGHKDFAALLAHEGDAWQVVAGAGGDVRTD